MVRIRNGEMTPRTTIDVVKLVPVIGTTHNIERTYSQPILTPKLLTESCSKRHSKDTFRGKNRYDYLCTGSQLILTKITYLLSSVFGVNQNISNVGALLTVSLISSSIFTFKILRFATKRGGCAYRKNLQWFVLICRKKGHLFLCLIYESQPLCFF